MEKIIFYDGFCPMCNAWVNRLVKWDKTGQFKFAPLDGETARKRLAPIFPDYLAENTIVLLENDKVYLRSDAAFKILRQFTFPYNLMSIGRIVPKFIRDRVYNAFANRRYSYGRRYETCPVPPVAWRDRFLP